MKKPAKQTPYEVYLAHLPNIPRIPDEDLERAFRHLKTRKVHKDGTFSFDGIIYEANAFSGQTIEIRYDPENLCDLYVYHGKKQLFRPQRFQPTHQLPAKIKKNVIEPKRKNALQSSQDYLESIVKRNQNMKEQESPSSSSEPKQILTVAQLLQTLELSEKTLATQDRNALISAFDTFGPFPLQQTITAIDAEIVRHGNKRHRSLASMPSRH